MRKITDEEYHKLLDTVPGLGYICFMGGSSPTEGSPCVVGLESGELHLFDYNEIGNDDWKRLMDLQEQEGQDYLNLMAK
jgi:hypothetical protein